jgi:hypothetical protein
VEGLHLWRVHASHKNEAKRATGVRNRLKRRQQSVHAVVAQQLTKRRRMCEYTIETFFG